MRPPFPEVFAETFVRRLRKPQSPRIAQNLSSMAAKNTPSSEIAFSSDIAAPSLSA